MMEQAVHESKQSAEEQAGIIGLGSSWLAFYFIFS